MYRHQTSRKGGREGLKCSTAICSRARIMPSAIAAPGWGVGATSSVLMRGSPAPSCEKEIAEMAAMMKKMMIETAAARP